MEEKEGQFCL